MYPIHHTILNLLPSIMFLHHWKLMRRYHNQFLSQPCYLLTETMKHRFLYEMQSVGDNYDIVALFIQGSVDDINKRKLSAFQTSHLLVLQVGVGIDSADIGIAHLSKGQGYLSAAACQIQDLGLETDERIVWVQFFLDQALDVVAMRVDILVSVFYVILINTNLRVNLPKPSLHYYYSITSIQFPSNNYHPLQLTSIILAICPDSDIYNQYLKSKIRMSSQPKKGMQFFKKAAEKGSSLFGGMKIKGPKEAKNVAQTETNFNFTEKNNQEKGTLPSTKDDFGVRQESKESERQKDAQVKTQELSIKKSSSRVSETSTASRKVEVVEAESPKEVKEPKEVVKAEPVEVKKIQVVERSVVEEKKPEKPAFVPTQRKKSQKIQAKKAEVDSSLRKPSFQVKQQKKREEQKPKKSDREQVLDQINQYNLKLAQSVITQRSIQTRIGEIKAEIEQLREKISRWDAEQNLCAERQEYEEADLYKNKIDQAMNQIDELGIELTFSEDQLLKQENEEVNLLKTQNGTMKKIGRRLKLIELQLQDDAAVIKRQEIQKIENLKNKQETERKKAQRIEKDIVYQTQQIAEFQKIFKQQQDGKLDPLFKEKAKLQSDKVDLQSQIKQLQRKLREKRSQLGETNKQLKSVNDTIAEINQSYQEENLKLKQRKNKLQILQNDHDTMKLQLDYIQNSIQEQSRTMDDKISKKLAQATEMSNLAKEVQQKQVNFDDQIERRRTAYDSFIHSAKLLKDFQEKHREEKEKVKEVENRKNSMASEISKLQEKRDNIRKKIPAIEVEQKKFADQKNYKAAGLKKAEIKELNDELTAVKEKIEAFIVQEHQLQGQLDDLKNAQKDNLEQQDQIQRNLAISQYNYYKVKIQKVAQYRQSLAKITSSNSKEKEKALRELAEVITRLNQEMHQINDRYSLQQGEKMEHVVHADEEAELIQENASDNEVDNEEEAEVEEQVVDNNHEEKQASHSHQQDAADQEPQESGYVPLQLD